MNNYLEEELEAVEVLPESNEVEASDVAEEDIEENDEKEIINSNDNENTEVVVDEENASTAATIVSTVPDIVPVYCTATLENCPDGVLSQEILSDDSYLVSNICNKTSHQHICNIHHADHLEATSTPTQY